MVDVGSALDLYKAARTSQDQRPKCPKLRHNSSNGLSSSETQLATPPPAASSSDSSTSDSPNTSVCAGPDDPSDEDVGGDSARTSHCRCVRFADEDGGDLVSDIRTTVDWWDEMVFGPSAAVGDNASHSGCPKCGYSSLDSEGKNTCAEEAKEGECRRCGASVSRPGHGELFFFVEELSMGVEATLLFPGVIGKKRRPVVLYTDDNGKSLCWIETGPSASAVPYRLQCKCLLEVTDQTGVSRQVGGDGEPTSIRAASHSVALSNETSFVGDDDHWRRPPETTGFSTRDSSFSTNSEARRRCADRGCNLPMSGKLGSEAAESGRSLAERVGGREGRGRAAGEIRVKIKWRTRPKFPVRKMTLVDVRCSTPADFVRGLLQLRGHNSELDDI